MKKLVLCFFVGVVLSGCAGMDQNHQRNMVINSGIWGGIGALAGAGIAAATGNNPVSGAIIGTIAGAAAGAANTPAPYPRYYYYPAPTVYGSPVWVGPGTIFVPRMF